MDIKCSSPSQDIEEPDPVLLKKAFADIDKLTDGLNIPVMKNCLPPCQRRIFFSDFLFLIFNDNDQLD